MSRWAPERVLVAIKPWQRGLPLESQHASQLADAFGARLMITSAVFDARMASDAGRDDAAAPAGRARLLEAERVELEKLAQSLRAWGTSVSTRVVWGVPAYQGVLDVAREWRADLLVVGAHEEGLRVGTRLTDTDWQLMRLAPCPLLLVKDPFFTGYRTVLAAVDPTHPSPAGIDRSVLDVARTVAEACESELRVVHALPDPAHLPPSPVEIAPGVYCDADAIEELHRRAVDDLLASHGVAPEQVDLVQGAPAEVIARAAADRRAELVVLGALRRSQLEQALLGSTAEAVAAEVPCDVLLVPAPHAASDVAGQAPGATSTAKTAKPRRRGASSAARGRRPPAR
ncbi:MAG TPA: universal stress protein [Gammaproteobacteria bacterium]|nr:universal stress protein [Gammaproteobacteria bacterium]